MKVLTLEELLAPYRPKVVAAAVGVTADTVRLWETGKSKPAAENVRPLADFLKVDPAVVLDAIAAQRQKAVA